MRHLLRAALCRLFGHGATVTQYGPWHSDPETGRYRVLSEFCVRCDGIAGPQRLLFEADMRRSAS